MDIVQEILSALEAEDTVMLATIISTSGSTPASAFSKMLVKKGGTSWVGTVGGGCMEGDVLEAARTLAARNKAQVIAFHLNEDEMVQGLICGGSLDVLIEPLGKEHVPLFQDLKSITENGEDAVLATLIDGHGGVLSKDLIPMSHGMERVHEQWSTIIHRSPIGGFSANELAGETLKAHHRNTTRRRQVADGELILEPVAGQPHLILFGGGHVSKSICSVAAMAGFRVTIVDDRKEYATRDRFPDAGATLALEFDDAFNHLSITPSTYIVIVTRGHRSDELLLERAVGTPARYIGMIGSQRKVLTTYEHLVEHGLQPERLERVHAPMGIEIGAVTTEEIGVSVVAQLIQVRRGATLRHKSEVMRDMLTRLKDKSRGSSDSPFADSHRLLT